MTSSGGLCSILVVGVAEAIGVGDVFCRFARGELGSEGALCGFSGGGGGGGVDSLAMVELEFEGLTRWGTTRKVRSLCNV